MRQTRSAPPDPSFTFRAHESSVTSISFHVNNIISGSETGEIIIWDLKTKRIKCKWQLNKFNQPHNSILWIGFLNDLLLTQSRNGFINVWEEVDGEYKLKKCYETSPLSFCQCDLYHDDYISLLAHPSCNDPNRIELLNIVSGEVECFIESRDSTKLGTITCFKLHKANENDGKNSTSKDFYLLCGYEIGKICLWHFPTGNLVSELNLFQLEPVLCLELDSKEPHKGVCGSINDKLVAWKISNNQLEKLQEIKLINPTINVLTLRVSSESLNPILCSGGKDGKIRIFSWKTLKQLAVLDFHNDGITSAMFCPETGYLAVGSKDKKISLWPLYVK